MTALVFDTSTRCTGWALYDDGNLVDSGAIDMKKSKALPDERTKLMSQEIIGMIDRIHPDVVAVEELHVSRNMVTTKALMRIIDVVYAYSILNDNFEFREVHPSTWRKAVGIKCKTKRTDAKAQSIEFVKNTYNKDVSDDEADAICVGYSLFIEE